MKLKDLNLSKGQIEKALSAQTDYTLTIQSKTHFVIQMLRDEDVGILNIYFSPKGKCRFVFTGQKPTALKFAMKLVNDISMGEET